MGGGGGRTEQNFSKNLPIVGNFGEAHGFIYWVYDVWCKEIDRLGPRAPEVHVTRTPGLNPSCRGL